MFHILCIHTYIYSSHRYSTYSLSPLHTDVYRDNSNNNNNNINNNNNNDNINNNGNSNNDNISTQSHAHIIRPGLRHTFPPVLEAIPYPTIHIKSSSQVYLPLYEHHHHHNSNIHHSNSYSNSINDTSNTSSDSKQDEDYINESMQVIQYQLPLYCRRQVWYLDNIDMVSSVFIYM